MSLSVSTDSPSTTSSAAMIAVDRAMAELRRGGAVLLRAPSTTPGGSDLALVLAAESADDDKLKQLAARTSTQPMVAMTGRRAMVLGLIDAPQPVVLLSLSGDLTAERVSSLADPLSLGRPEAVNAIPEIPAWAEAAVTLAKLSRLLPAVVAAPLSEIPETACILDAEDVMAYQQASARTLSRVSEARVPLVGAESARVIAFRPADGGIEHLAIVIGEPGPDSPVLTRLHSECFTGDILGSLRCDCGDQLRGAIAEIGRVGTGVLLYLAQEGRGIGLVNKLRAYQLQDEGFDTLDANLQLGFDDDERIYLPAAEILRLLGITTIRLLTNNPAKVDGLARHGVTVAERVPHVFPSNKHNVFYLKTKATRSGHLF